MATVTEITGMCKAGRLADAYNAAKYDMTITPGNIWSQRGMWWALYYTIKADTEKGNLQDAFAHLDEVATLDLLRLEKDDLTYTNIARMLTNIVKCIPQDRFDLLDKVFAFAQNYIFSPSKEYSYFLKVCCAFNGWNNLVTFVEWWNLDNLMPENYQKFRTAKGKTIISLAESAYIAYSKALLKLADKHKIEAFLPRLERLADEHTDMMYPGYYYAKLIHATSSDTEKALKKVLPLIEKKKSEFWIWQFMSEMYMDDEGMHLASLLRASHCRTEEKFLVKIRSSLLEIYLAKNDFPRAKYQLDKVIECRKAEGWGIHSEQMDLLRSEWYIRTKADASDPIDYMQWTDSIFLRNANESNAVVVYVNNERGQAIVIYAEKKTAVLKPKNIGFEVKQGDLLKVQWKPDEKRGIRILNAKPLKVDALQPETYLKAVKGKVAKLEGNNFAFVKAGKQGYYVAPDVVKKCSLENGENVSAIAALNYNKRKDEWKWMCINIERITDDSHKEVNTSIQK